MRSCVMHMESSRAELQQSLAENRELVIGQLGENGGKEVNQDR
jgi:hypothetical protein